MHIDWNSTSKLFEECLMIMVVQIRAVESKWGLDKMIIQQILDPGVWDHISIYAALCDMYMFYINVHKYKLPNPRISIASVYLHLNWKLCVHTLARTSGFHSWENTWNCAMRIFIPGRKMSLNSTFVMALTSIF